MRHRYYYSSCRWAVLSFVALSTSRTSRAIWNVATLFSAQFDWKREGANTRNLSNPANNNNKKRKSLKQIGKKTGGGGVFRCPTGWQRAKCGRQCALHRLRCSLRIFFLPSSCVIPSSMRFATGVFFLSVHYYAAAAALDGQLLAFSREHQHVCLIRMMMLCASGNAILFLSLSLLFTFTWHKRPDPSAAISLSFSSSSS